MRKTLPAFPFSVDLGTIVRYSSGMDIRDFLAAIAMHGIVSDLSSEKNMNAHDNLSIAVRSVALADALCAELTKE